MAGLGYRHPALTMWAAAQTFSNSGPNMTRPVTELLGTAPAVSHAMRGTGATAAPVRDRSRSPRASRSVRTPSFD
jgi:hypothetical protein